MPLNKLGIRTLEDLLSYFPRRWEDRTLERPIRELAVGEYACVRAMLAGDPTASRISGGRTLVKVRAVDDSGALDVAFFNQDYRRTSLHKGETYIFYGKVEGDLLRRRMTNPVVEPEGRQLLTGRIMPIYPLAAGVSQTLLAKAMRQGLDACRDLLPDVLPDEVRRAYHLCYTGYAYENIHFPNSPEALDIARRRLVFEELFVLACGLQLLRSRRETGRGPACKNLSLTPFYDALPFALTGAQRRAVEQAVSDMTSGRVMNPPVSGRRGQRQDHGGRGLRLVRRPERLAVGTDGSHGDPGPPALRESGPPVRPLRAALCPAHRLYPRQGAPCHSGRAGRRYR